MGRKRMAAYVASLAGLLLLPAGALGQSATTGSIAGVVRDATGAVLPGVTVEAASPALIEKVRTAVPTTSVNTSDAVGIDRRLRHEYRGQAQPLMPVALGTTPELKCLT